MAKIKFFIRATKKADQANIRVRFYQGRLFDVTANTTKQINPAYWNNATGKVRQRAEFPEGEDLAKKLNNLQRHIEEKYDTTPDKTQINSEWLNTTIDEYYNPGKYINEKTTLFGFIQNFVDNSGTRINTKTGNPVCYKMRREYEVTFDYLREYCDDTKELDFIDIDLEFYQDFVAFLRKKGLATNTIGKKIQTLKIFLNAATEQGINKYQKFRSRNFKTLTEDVDNIYLTKEELQKFYNHDFSNNPKLERVRDLFLVGCWTGCRFSDLNQITPDKIKGDFIEFKQKKTGQKVVIPIHPTVVRILKKYDGKLPGLISNQKYNEYLKQAAEIAEINETFIKSESKNGLTIEKKYPKYELITSHTARRSFCTNAYKDNIPTLAIMSISGHRTEKAFLKYIKADGMEHAKKVLEAWRKNAEHMRTAQ